MKISKLTLIVLFIFLSYAFSANLRIQGTITGQGLIRNASTNPKFRIIFLGVTDSINAVNDGVGLVASYDYGKLWVTNQHIFKTFIRHLTPGFITLEPDTFYDNLSSDTLVRRNFIVKDIARPEIINVSVPNQMYKNSTDTLRHTVFDNSSWVTSQLIEISYNNQSWELVSDTLKNIKDSIATPGSAGEFRKIPFTVTKADTAIFRLIYGDAEGNYDTAFSNKIYIIDTTDTTKPVVAVNTIQNVLYSSTYDIKWTATDNKTVVSRAIYLSRNSGSTYTLLDSVNSNTGTWAWSVPDAPSKKCFIKINAYDLKGNQGYGISNKFEIIGDTVKPAVAINAIYQLLQPLSTYDIKWTATDNKAVVSRAIYLSRDSGSTYTLLDSLNSNTGTWSWTVPNNPSKKCFVKICVYDNAYNKGEAISNMFEIMPQTGIINNNKTIVKGTNSGFIINLEKPKQISLYKLNGRCLFTKKYPVGYHILYIPHANEILILRVGSESIRINL